MASINKVILIGNLGADPEMRTMPNGDAVANIRLATTESWKDKATGEKKELTEWHRVVFYRKLAEIVGQYLKKGAALYIEGRIRTRKWQDKEGQERYTTEIEANEMQMLGGRQSVVPGESSEFDGGYETSQARPQTQTFSPRPPTSAPGGAKRTTTAFNPDDDDIPFLNSDVINDILGCRLERRMLKVRPILYGDDL